MKTNEIKTRAIPANTPSTKKESGTWIYFVVGSILIIAGLVVAFSNGEPQVLADEETTICIAEKSIMYGADWCGYCKRQKSLFGENVDLLNIVDCDENPTSCDEEGIKLYPTWIIEGEHYEGVQQVGKLKELTGCQNDQL